VSCGGTNPELLEAPGITLVERCLAGFGHPRGFYRRGFCCQRDRADIISPVKAALKIVIAAAAVPVALAVLAALYAGARHRALVSHCRNNLRHLGGLAGRNWENLDKQKTGRLFWQEVREAQYHALDGTWSVPADREPFTCPVIHSGLHPRPEDPGSIDYLGPREVRRDPRRMPKAEPIAADRPGNHPSGGLVLRLDTSVDDLTPVIDGEDPPAWAGALPFLKD